MARIELRDCDVILRDGFGGTAAVNDSHPIWTRLLRSTRSPI